MGARGGEGRRLQGFLSGAGGGTRGLYPSSGGSPRYPTCCLPFFSLWAQVLPLPWGWGWGTWHRWAGLLIRWDSVSLCLRSKEQVTL